MAATLQQMLLRSNQGDPTAVGLDCYTPGSNGDAEPCYLLAAAGNAQMY